MHFQIQKGQSSKVKTTYQRTPFLLNFNSTKQIYETQQSVSLVNLQTGFQLRSV